jgi:hypothetical protein
MTTPRRSAGLGCLRLEDRLPPAAHLLAVGPDASGPPTINVYDTAGAVKYSILAYDVDFAGGVRVATGDVTGDGTDDIVTVPGPGGGPHVRIFDGTTGKEVRSFFGDASADRLGLTVAVADVTGDGRADVVLGTGPGGGPRVTVFDGATGVAVRDFFAYDPGFRGGVNVAAGDVTGDGKAEIITAAGRGGGPQVRVFDGAGGGELRSFFAADPGFTGGVSVAAADVTGDGRADVVTGSGVGTAPDVRVYDGPTGAQLRGFAPYTASFTGGVSVAAVDLTGDGIADVVTAPGPGGGPQVRVYDGPTGAAAKSFFAYVSTYQGGVTTGSGWYVIPPPAPPETAPVFVLPDFSTLGLTSFVPSVYASLGGDFVGSAIGAFF